jgi:opacity protein-like surface antigen
MNSRKPCGTLVLALVLAAAGSARGDGVSLEARGAYFSPSDAAFREIYGYGVSWGGEISFAVSKRASVWAGGDYFSKLGKLGFTEEETKIRIAPLAAGLKYHFASDRLRPYIGAGVGYFQYKEANSIGTIEKGALGLIGRAGLLVMLGPAFFIDLQGSWSTCSVQPLDVRANIGGFSFGLGLGFEF